MAWASTTCSASTTSRETTPRPRPINPMTMASSVRYAKLGDVLQLTVTNMTGAHHPFHLHGFSIQPISLTDTMPGATTPNSNDASPEPATVRIPVPRVPGQHRRPGGIHADVQGPARRPAVDGRHRRLAAAWEVGLPLPHLLPRQLRHDLRVRRGRPDGNERPYINANTDAVTVNEGQVARRTARSRIRTVTRSR